MPTVGLIFPPADYPIPPDAGRLYPSGVKFIGNGLGFNGMTIESYNEAIPRATAARPRAGRTRRESDLGVRLVDHFL